MATFGGAEQENFDQYDPAFGAPKKPKYYNPAWDEETGQLKPGFQSTPTSIAGGLNTSALDKYRSIATSDGASPWAKMQMQSQQTDTQNALQSAGRENASQLAQARSGLAMRGGMSGGASALMQQQAMRNQMQTSQDIRRAALGARQGIGVEDQKMKMGAMANLPGMEMQAMQPRMFDATNKMRSDEFNITNSLREIGSKQDYNLKNYEEQMKAYSAYQAAEAEKYAAKHK
jgi:hypothetical protein